jgi:2-alkyl-3-oxoalkanoate reductase
MSKRALVTGISGFLGGALGRCLRARSWHVTGISRRPPSPGSTDAHISGDLSRMPLPNGSFDAIIHCAALAAPWGPASRFQRHNVLATRRVLTIPASHLVFISSSSVHYTYGDQLNLTEHTPLPLEPINHYARTKREAERLVESSGIPHTILRPRAIFGPEDTVLFPRILRAARKGMLPRIRRPDGTEAIGDLIYIDNLTYFIAQAVDNKILGTYNLTNHEPVALFPFLESIFLDLQFPRITRAMSASTAFGFASALELLSGLTLNRWEPPLTRFGIEVLVHSKTFEPTKSRQALGLPPIPMEEARRRFVAWQKQQ